MRINRLEVENLRVFEHAGFNFQKGMNLLAGENGSGKTIILDALRASLSRILPVITANRCRPLPSVEEDIRAGSGFMTIKCTYEFQDDEFTCAIRKKRTGCAEPESASQEGEFLSSSIRALKTAGNKPLGVFYSNTRSLIPGVSPSKGRNAGARFNPFAGALSPRHFIFKEFAIWMWTLEGTSSETPMNSRRLAALKETAKRFLPGCRDLKADTLATPRLVMDMNGQTIDLRDLSGGELGIMALVLDLARRLMEANPGLPDPVRDGSAIVLIDELELHLHPRRQRTIVRELTENFPNCQFIATTHSPQLISSVRPEQLFLLKGGEVARPPRTLGMDSNWILGSLMGADERSFEATAAIEEVEAMMTEWELETARERIAQRRGEGFDLPYWSILEARMARMEDLFEREP